VIPISNWCVASLLADLLCRKDDEPEDPVIRIIMYALDGMKMKVSISEDAVADLPDWFYPEDGSPELKAFLEKESKE
jgi:hypothetical protein